MDVSLDTLAVENDPSLGVREWARGRSPAASAVSVEFLTTGIAAEVNQVLATILAAVELHGSCESDRPDCLDCVEGCDLRAEVLQQVHRCRRTLADALALSRGAPFAKEPGDIRLVVQHASQSLPAEEVQRGVRIGFTLCRESARVEMSSLALQQCLAALVLRAARQAPDGACVRIQVERHADLVRISIAPDRLLIGPWVPRAVEEQAPQFVSEIVAAHRGHLKMGPETAQLDLPVALTA